jgi:hypothetical protein
MNEREVYWLNMCSFLKEDYRIDVDNDCVFVTDLQSGDCVFEFDHDGSEMVLYLLRHIGCNASEV